MIALAPSPAWKAPPMSRAAGRPSLLQSASAFIFVFSYAFDFRSLTVGGEPVQFVFLALATASLSLAVVSLLDQPVRLVRGTSWPLLLGAAVVIGSTFSTLLNQVPFGNFVRLEQRYVLMLGGMCLAFLWLSRGYSFRVLLDLMFWSAAVSMVWTFVYSSQVVAFDVLRYRATSPSFALVIAVGFSELLTRTRPRLTHILLTAMALLLVYWSDTRTYLMSTVAMLLYLGVYIAVRSDRRALRRLGIVVVGAAAAVIFLWLTGGLDGWLGRFRQSGWIEDPTALARMAEYVAQLHLLSEAPVSLAFGRGLGAEYQWISQLPQYFSKGLGLDARFEFGHSLWVYSFFSSGLLFGWFLPALFLAGFWRAVALIRRAASPWSLPVALYLVSTLPATFTSYPLGTRHAAVILGMCFAALPFMHRTPDA